MKKLKKINCFECNDGLNEYIQGRYFEGCINEYRENRPESCKEMEKIIQCDYFTKR